MGTGRILRVSTWIESHGHEAKVDVLIFKVCRFEGLPLLLLVDVFEDYCGSSVCSSHINRCWLFGGRIRDQHRGAEERSRKVREPQLWAGTQGFIKVKRGEPFGPYSIELASCNVEVSLLKMSDGCV